MYKMPLNHFFESLTQYVVAGPLFAGIIFVIFWYSMLRLVATFGPWKKLSTMYPAHVPSLVGDTFNAFVFALGKSKYKSIMNIWVNSQGMFFRPMLLFRAGHDPIFIPWSEIEKVEGIKSHNGTAPRMMRLHLRQNPEAEVMIDRHTFRKINEHKDSIGVRTFYD